MLDSIDKVANFKQLIFWNGNQMANQYKKLMIVYHGEDSAGSKKGHIIYVKG